MAIRVSRYVPPGVYIQEEVVQPIPAFIGLPRQLVLIGEGDPCKLVTDESVVRAYINQEAVTVNPSTLQFTLSKTSDGKKSSMFLFKNGDQQVADAFSVVNATTIQIAAAFFDPTATYTFSYQATTATQTVDKLAFDVNVPCGAIVRVGSFPGTSDFVSGTDYVLVSSGVAWLSPTAPTITGSTTETFSGLVGQTFNVTLNGGIEQSVTFSNGNFANPNAATAAEVVTVLNTNITGMAAFASGGHVVLQTTAVGNSATIQVGAGTSNSILGFLSGQFAQGAGKNPAQGATYFVTYHANRPATDFNTPILSTSFDQFIAKVGPISSTNALALAGQIAFEQQPPFLYHIQVQNTGTGQAAQDIDYITAIKGAELNPDLTDIVVLGHPTLNAGGVKPLVRAALRDHVIQQSSLINKAERMGWFGMPVGTVAGDGETAGTFVFVATQELQVAADSPGRGRFVLTGPSFVQKTFRFPDGSAKQLKLDSTYLATAVAALQASFLSPAEGLLRKELVGFDAVEIMNKGDRDFMASNGVNLVDTKGGRFLLFDPVTTDQSSAEFREINVMAQKDNIVKRVRNQLDATIVGLVPDDLAQFVFEVKSQIATQLNAAIADGAIAPFQNNDGSIRNIDLATDIIVQQRKSDPTTYDFRFFFFVKFIAKRLFGTYSVAVPSGA
jgi:hypothetical protein